MLPPPPEKNNSSLDALPTLQDYERLVSGCTRLCENYNSLLYSYRILLTQLESVMTYNYTMLSHCLSGCKPVKNVRPCTFLTVEFRDKRETSHRYGFYRPRAGTDKS